MPLDWKDESRIISLDKSMDENVFISNDEYRLMTGSKQQEEYEKKRRVGDYKLALSSFQNTVCKSCLKSITYDYYNARLKTWGILRNELFHKSRTIYKFMSFKKRTDSHSLLCK